jgi:hypothetical protein
MVRHSRVETEARWTLILKACRVTNSSPKCRGCGRGFAIIVIARATSSAGTIRRYGPRCRSHRIHCRWFPIGRSSSVAAYGIASRSTSRFLTRLEAMNRTVNKPPLMRYWRNMPRVDDGLRCRATTFAACSVPTLRPCRRTGSPGDGHTKRRSAWHSPATSTSSATGHGSWHAISRRPSMRGDRKSRGVEPPWSLATSAPPPTLLPCHCSTHPAARSVSLVISGGTPKRPGSTNVPSPRFTYRKADCRACGATPPSRPSGPNGRRYRPATNGVTRLAGLHWRSPSAMQN